MDLLSLVPAPRRASSGIVSQRAAVESEGARPSNASLMALTRVFGRITKEEPAALA
jgi:hypothetical protein